MAADEEAIRAVLVRYCHYCDEGRWNEWGELYTEEATFTVMGETHRGRETIKEWIAAAQPVEQRGRHMLSQPLIEIDGDRARCWTDYTFVGRRGSGLAVTSAGRYHDELVREGGTWRFVSRKIVFMGEEPGNQPSDV